MPKGEFVATSIFLASPFLMMWDYPEVKSIWHGFWYGRYTVGLHVKSDST